MSSTELAYAATRQWGNWREKWKNMTEGKVDTPIVLQMCYVMPSTGVNCYQPLRMLCEVRCAPYAMSGTDLAYAAMSLGWDAGGRRRGIVWRRRERERGGGGGEERRRGARGGRRGGDSEVTCFQRVSNVFSYVLRMRYVQYPVPSSRMALPVYVNAMGCPVLRWAV
eukprot:798661-Rhodomonas_salina.1